MDPKRKMYVHDHSPLAKECNVGCGWYELGEQLTFYSATLKRGVKFEEAMKKDNFMPESEKRDIARQAGFGS
jgi:hypothetical protein